MKGCDYSWDRPDLSCLKNQGCGFIVRYGSRDPNKNLSAGELDAILSLGLSVAVVWQEGKTQMLRGYSGGQTDARDADALFQGLGLWDIPVYFSCDQDYEACSSEDKAKIDAYCDGSISVIGKPRMGGYGDDTFCKRQFDTGRITYGWQTYGWSEGAWEQRCQLRQVQNNVTVCGGKIDWDESKAEDFGQYPRPRGTSTGEDMTPAVTFWDGKLYQAMRWSDGRVCYAGPDTGGGFWAVDENSHAKSGVDIAISPEGKIVIAYVNMGGEVCHYVREPGGGLWAWVKIGGSA